MKCLTMVSATELRLQAGFSTHDILLAHTSIRAVQGSEVIPGENRKRDILPHKVQ